MAYNDDDVLMRFSWPTRSEDAYDCALRIQSTFAAMKSSLTDDTWVSFQDPRLSSETAVDELAQRLPEMRIKNSLGAADPSLGFYVGYGNLVGPSNLEMNINFSIGVTKDARLMNGVTLELQRAAQHHAVCDSLSNLFGELVRVWRPYIGDVVTRQYLRKYMMGTKHSISCGGWLLFLNERVMNSIAMPLGIHCQSIADVGCVAWLSRGLWDSIDVQYSAMLRIAESFRLPETLPSLQRNEDPFE